MKELKSETSSKTNSYKSQKTQPTTSQQQPNINKPQQNSYPLYAPKTQQNIQSTQSTQSNQLIQPIQSQQPIQPTQQQQKSEKHI